MLDQVGAELLCLLDHAHHGAGQVHRVIVHDAWMLCGLSSEKGASGSNAGSGQGGDDGEVSLRVEGANGHVVHETEWPRSDSSEVVDAHGDEVEPDPVPHLRPTRNLELGPYAVGRHHQDRLAKPGWYLDPGGKPPEHPNHLLGPRRSDGLGYG